MIKWNERFLQVIGMAKKYRIKNMSAQLHAKVRVPEVKLIKVPNVRQKSNYDCGVACVQSILRYAGIELNLDQLVEILKTTPAMGTNHLEMEMFLNNCEGISAGWKGDMTFQELESYIVAGRPVICCLQAWHDVKSEYGHYDYTDEWEDGHYAIAIGCDKENVYFMDPSTCGNYTFITREHLKTRWHDTDGDGLYRRAGIIVTVDKPVFDRDEIISMN